MIVRDELGLVLASMGTTIPFITDPTVAKAMAAWKAVAFGSDLGFQRVNLEGNALEIVNVLQHASSFWSRYGQLIEDVRLNSL